MTLLEAEVIQGAIHWGSALSIVWALVVLMCVAMLTAAINSRTKKGPPS